MQNVLGKIRRIWRRRAGSKASSLCKGPMYVPMYSTSYKVLGARCVVRIRTWVEQLLWLRHRFHLSFAPHLSHMRPTVGHCVVMAADCLLPRPPTKHQRLAQREAVDIRYSSSYLLRAANFLTIFQSQARPRDHRVSWPTGCSITGGDSHDNGKERRPPRLPARINLLTDVITSRPQQHTSLPRWGMAPLPPATRPLDEQNHPLRLRR